MNETKLEAPTRAETKAVLEPGVAGEIRVLEDLELALAGGGDQADGWP